MTVIRRRALLAGFGSVAIVLVSGCQGSAPEHVSTPGALADYTGLRPGSPAPTYPAFVTSAVADGYQFAVKRPDVLAVLPCYCGCGLTSGHQSNLDCFIAGVGMDGGIVFDEHASFCQTCLDIARDASQLVAQGKSLPDVRAYVDKHNGSKGPGTDTPLPPGSPSAPGG